MSTPGARPARSDLHAWLPSTEDVRDFSPVFSPDNKTMIFARSRFYGKYSPIAQPRYHAWDFYAADVDSSNIRQLTNERFYNASRFSVPPDGKSMVVVTESVDSPEQIAIYSLDHAEKPLRVVLPHVHGPCAKHWNRRATRPILIRPEFPSVASHCHCENLRLTVCGGGGGPCAIGI